MAKAARPVLFALTFMALSRLETAATFLAINDYYIHHHNDLIDPRQGAGSDFFQVHW